jgi:hypothetical protein
MSDPIREALAELVEMYFSEDRRDADWFEKYQGVWIAARAALAAPVAHPLTGEQIMDLPMCYHNDGSRTFLLQFARDVERAHGIGSKP